MYILCVTIMRAKMFESSATIYIMIHFYLFLVNYATNVKILDNFYVIENIVFENFPSLPIS